MGDLILKFVAAVVVSVCVVCSFGCEQSNVNSNRAAPGELETQPTPEATKPPIPAELLNLSPSQLCDRLAEIRVLPTFEPTPTDAIYEAVVAKGEDAIYCLIGKISDKTPMPDPRYSVPHWQHYAVGDTAVFILVDILRNDDLEREKLLIEMLPPEYREEWKTNGVYAYFNYVSEPKNRKELRRWWKKWVSENKK